MKTHRTTTRAQRFTQRLARRGNLSPRGLALLDVLIGMAIFGFIAAVAVVGLGQFFQTAHKTGVTSDVRSIATLLEGSANSDGVLPQTSTSLKQDGNKVVLVVDPLDSTKDRTLVTLTKGNRFDGYRYIAPAGNVPAGFQLCIRHYADGDSLGTGGDVDASAMYDSIEGGIVAAVEGNAEDACATLNAP